MLNQELLLACKDGKLNEAMDLLIQPGIGLNQPDNNGWTPLSLACMNGHTEIVERLLMNPGILLNQADNAGWTPLHWACANGDANIVKLLLKHPDIEVNRTNINKATPLLYACAWGKAETVELLLKHPDIDINQANIHGTTPLSEVCKSGCHNILLQLLQHRRLNLNDETKYIFNSVLQTTLETNNDILKKCAVLLYIRRFKPENPENNNLYQNWLLYDEKTNDSQNITDMTRQIKKSNLKAAKEKIVPLLEQCIFSIQKNRVDTASLPSPQLLIPPQPLSNALYDFIEDGGMESGYIVKQYKI